MGLDITFAIKNKNNEDYYLTLDDFRKVNFLIPFFNYYINMEDLEIELDAIYSLLNVCLIVYEQQNEEISKRLLPTCEGFFFGSLEYDEYYYQDVYDVLQMCEMIRDEIKLRDDDYIIMSCWW